MEDRLAGHYLAPDALYLLVFANALSAQAAGDIVVMPPGGAWAGAASTSASATTTQPGRSGNFAARPG